MIAAALEDPDWIEDAVATIARLALSQREFSGDDLRRELRPAPDPKSMPGSAFSEAKRRGLIKAVDFRPSSSKSRNGGRGLTWTRKTKGEL